MSTNIVKPLYLQIDELLQCTTIDPLRNCFYKLPCHFRDTSSADEKVYEPQVVSIGPYHHGKDHLKAMEMYKVHYLNRLLVRRKEQSVERYVAALKAKEKKALDCYAGSLEIDGDALVKMMLLDGCFIVELIRMSQIEELRDEKFKDLIPFIVKRVMRDLLLFENQLPFFILLDLFEMTTMPNDHKEGFIPMAVSFFSHILPVFKTEVQQFPNPESIKHLMELLHWSCFSIPENSTAGTVAVSLGTSNMPSSVKGREYGCREFIPSATELRAAGVYFEKSKGDFNGLFAITFKLGIMFIPAWVIDENTESIFRNLVSYEQGRKDTCPRLVTDYIILMHCFVKTEEDVEFLSGRGIIKNLLGNSERVASMISRLRECVLTSGKDFLHAHLFTQLNSYRNQMLNRWVSILRLDYFNTPWAAFNLYLTVLVLILTILQTFKAFA